MEQPLLKNFPLRSPWDVKIEIKADTFCWASPPVTVAAVATYWACSVGHVTAAR